MDIKLTEYVRATTLTLNIKDAPMTALPLIKDAFAKLATDLDMLLAPEDWVPERANIHTEPGEVERQREAFKEAVAAQIEAIQQAEQPAKRRGRPKKVEEPAPAVEPTPLEQAIAATEDKEQQGESEPAKKDMSDAGESVEVSTDGTTTNGSTITTSSTVTTPASPSEPVSDSDLQKYCVKLAQHYGGPQKVFDFAKQFVEEGAVARPSNIKGDDKRWAFIKAVEEDSNVRYHG